MVKIATAVLVGSPADWTVTIATSLVPASVPAGRLTVAVTDALAPAARLLIFAGITLFVKVIPGLAVTVKESVASPVLVTVN